MTAGTGQDGARPRGRGRHAAGKRKGRRAQAPPDGPAGGGKGGLARSSMLMALGTMVSRATGLIRTMLQAAALGTGLLASTYNTANTVPTSLYTLLIGGALNAVLVPQLVRARSTHADGGSAYEQRLVTMVLCVLGTGTLLAVWCAPQIVSVYMENSPGHHAAFELTVTFARFLLPQIFFYGVFSIFGQVLNARERFGAMMWTPVLNNAVLIAMFGLYLGILTVPDRVEDITSAQTTLLGIGTTGALALQALALVPFARAAGFRPRPRFDWRGSGLGGSVRAARWTLLLVLANLAAMTVVTRYANAADDALPHGGVGYSAYSYAQTFWMLPQSIATVSVMTALLPRLSRAAVEGRLGDLRDGMSRTLRVTGTVIVPAAFFFVALGPQLAEVVFAHGAADPSTAVPLGQMLQALGLGLIPFSAQYVLLRGFYAFEDTRTPFLMAAATAAVNIALATACHLLLSPRWAVTGMAGAYSLSYLAGMGLTLRLLRRRMGGRIDGRRLAATYAKLIAASGVAAALGWAAARGVSGRLPFTAASGTADTLVALVAGAVVLVAAFLLCGRAMRIDELRRLPGMR
ncbi:murein biosynthesis integral membrane protein MurJ [Streptomyces tsukubensis]|uniref:Murein biosynthesis integral membrane protein MurJ n=1 Tax=Streptomyces tsukubensis TaxID=83656 RepID=A0A1V4A781_9ACTN|nr:murein biosynthesis integral membrane protein MurJ [Streptomyces tsukubensis]